MFKKKVSDDLVDVSTPKKAGSFQLGKGAKIGIAIAAVAVIGVGAKLLLGGGGKMDYVSTLNSIFSNELGTFRYVVSVNTGEAGTVITSGDKVASMEELNAMVGNIEDSNSSAASKYEFSDWNKYADVKSGDWKHPVYQIVIEGCTTSVEPLATHFSVSIATPFTNAPFTDVTCFNNNYYVDVETMRTWLLNSSDSYLVELGETLPQGSKYLVIPEAEFKYASRYAEAGEKDLSTVTGMVTMYRRFLSALSSTSSTVSGVVDSKCFSSTKDTAKMVITGEDSVKVLNATKSLVNQVGDFHDSLITSGVSNSLYNEQQATQARREKDNIISAFEGLALALNTADFNAMNLQASGFCRSFVNGQNNKTIEGTLGVMFTNDGTDYSIELSAVRSGDKTEVTLPNGSQLALADLQNMGSGDVVVTTLNSIGDYFNFTGIATEKQLEITPDAISKTAIADFIDLVNGAGTYDVWLTEHNFQDFVDKYMNYKEDNTSTQLDLANAKLMSDFVQSLNGVTGGLVVEKVVQAEEEIEQYPELTFSQQGIDFTFKYNAELSSPSLIVLDGEAINKGDSSFEVDLTNFSIQTLLGSIYPANNETLLLAHDNTFDMTVAPLTLQSMSKSWNDFKLYFVVSDDGGHMDLFFGGTQRGAVVEY